MSGFLKKKWVRYLLILVVGGSVIGYFLLSSGEKAEYVLAEAESIFKNTFIARDLDAFQIAKGGDIRRIRKAQK